MSEFSKFNRARLDDRQVTELIGMARGMMADDVLSDAEIEYMYKWLAASSGTTQNPMINTLAARFEDVLADGIVDEEERQDLLAALKALAGPDFEMGEALKSTTLPLCAPAPQIAFPSARFTFTGAFVFGTRKACEAAVEERGGKGGSLRKDTQFLVIGEYASDDWIHSTYGRKIEKAVDLRDAGVPINIISEAHWRTFL